MPDISSHPFLLLVFPISLFAIITHPFSHLRNLVSYLTLPFMTTKSSSYVINFTPKLFLLFFSTALIQATITFSWATRLMLYPDFPIQICPTSVHFLHNIFQNLLELYIFFSQEKKKHLKILTRPTRSSHSLLLQVHLCGSLQCVWHHAHLSLDAPQATLSFLQFSQP